jgi:glycosyltransferase involved in cell wall biosynthesis
VRSREKRINPAKPFMSLLPQKQPGGSGLRELAAHVRLTPHDKGLAEKFFDILENPDRYGGGDDAKEYQDLTTEYLILKYFHGQEKWRHLNRLARHFQDREKHHLASLCLLESVRINPLQPEIFRLYEENKHLALPGYLEKGPEPECTVSVIMGTYNRTHEIKESIQSVLGQTFQDFELIVINDGGRDEVESIVRSFHSSKIRYFKLEENRGHAAALNEGARNSRGRYIAYLDDDDAYYPDHLERLLNALISSQRKFAYSNTMFVQGTMEDGKFRQEAIIGIWSDPHDKNKLIRECYIANLSMLHERSLFSEIGLYSEDLNAVMDWELLLRASLKYDFHHLDVITGEYRFGGTNITSTNRLTVDFHETLIQNYYLYYRGILPSIQYHLRNHGEDSALRLYQEIKGFYEEYFKATRSLIELLEIASFYKDDEFANRILSDLFRIDPRGCLNHIYHKKSARMFCILLPYMPRKIFKVLSNRYFRDSGTTRVGR